MSGLGPGPIVCIYLVGRGTPLVAYGRSGLHPGADIVQRRAAAWPGESALNGVVSEA